ncbi:MAG: hypothetical protein C5B59_11525 [Bacteroidetes bacterium]|nr:MAG: hypothetical protein C5B59_11525 [Bacteroidota bacterium]
MAFVPLTPINQAVTLWKGVAQILPFKFLNSAAGALDVSGWYGLVMSVYALVNGENCHLGTLDLTGTDVFASSVNTFSVTNAMMTSLNALPSGSYSYAVQGNETNGDDVQTLASGSLTLMQPNDFTPAP